MDSDFNTKIQKQKISRERRKELKNRLKKEKISIFINTVIWPCPSKF